MKQRSLDSVSMISEKLFRYKMYIIMFRDIITYCRFKKKSLLVNFEPKATLK